MTFRYVNPFTDYGFKKLFGEEASKPLLKDFLNCLLPANAQINDLRFKNSEKFGSTDADRKAIFDIYCEGLDGAKFIVELQKAKQNYFKDRTVFYSSFPIQEQAQMGEWNYQLQPVFCIGVLDFKFDTSAKDSEEQINAKATFATNPEEVLHTVQLKDQNNKVFYEKLTFIYLEMPYFKKQEHELVTRLEKWLYFLRHLQDLQEIPQIFGGEDLFRSAFAKAELAGMSPEEHRQYEASLKVYRDLKGVIDTAKQEGREEGLTEAHRRLVAKGFSAEQASEMLGLPVSGKPDK